MRAIDADALVYESIDSSDTLRHESYYGTGILAIRKEDIDDAPTIEPEQRWIPCSERLPKLYGNYLVATENAETDIGTINPYDAKGWSLCDANGFFWAKDRGLNIIAWMPLPEPYREEGKTE